MKKEKVEEKEIKETTANAKTKKTTATKEVLKDQLEIVEVKEEKDSSNSKKETIAKKSKKEIVNNKEEASKENEETKAVADDKKDSSKDKVMSILKSAKEKGKITYGELAVKLGDVDAEEIDKVFEAFEKYGVNILKDDDDIVGITTWINERYVKDTSRKVRDAIKDRLKQGIYISGPRYGYIKGKNGELTVNEEVRGAVETIFDLYEEGYGTTAIAIKLNKEYDFKNP